MANFKTPHTFVAGTKAKAEEVNENFSAIKDELNKKIDADNEGYITIKDAISDNQPISKSQFDTAKNEIESSITEKIQNKELKKSFLFEFGNIDSETQPDLLDIEDTTKLVFKIDDGTNYNPLKGTLANGSNFERDTIPDINIGELADGTYNLFIGTEGACIPIANTIYKQKKEPEGLVEKSWTQPVMASASNNGTLGGDKFAVSSTGATSDLGGAVWQLFKGYTGGSYGTGSAIAYPNGYWIFYNPTPIKITTLTIVNCNNVSYNDGAISKGDILASNDNSTWTTIKSFTNSTLDQAASWNIDLSDNENFYKYYKILPTAKGVGNTSINAMDNITITATQQTGVNLLNSVWLNTLTKPYSSKKYTGTSWEDFDYVPLPQNITVKNGVITEVNKCGNYNDNGWDDYIILPDYSRSTTLTKNTSFKATLIGWISNGTCLVQPLFVGETFTPSADGYVFYAMKGA